MIQGIGQDIVEIPAFGHDITEVRAMGELVWQKSTSIPDYLCFTALEAGQFTLTIPAAVTATYLSYIEWSKDGRTWNHRDNTSGEVVTIQVDVASGGKVYWRGKAQRYATSTTNYCCFSSDCRFTAKGVLKSLLFAEDFVTHVDGTWTSVYNYALSQLFRGCTTLIDASELILPSGHLAVAQLLGLFRDCTNLVRGADLPATGVNVSSYYWLYYNCTSLERLPNIAATTITDISGGNGNYAFYYAFYDCTSMTGSVTLNLTQVKGKQLFDTCFRGCKISSVDITMQSYDLQGAVFRNCFYLCTNLNHVRCTIDPSLATSDDFQNWLSGVSSTGTFIQAEGVEWPRGASGIPTGWLAYDEGEDIPNDYTPCDYIYNRSTGGGGVDLGFKFRLLDYSVEAKFKQDEISNGMVCGTNANDSGAIWYYNYMGRGSFRVYACYLSTWRYDREGFTPIDTNTHIIRYVGDADGCYLISDGTQSTSTNLSTLAADESTNNLFIFGRAISSNTYKGRIYYLKVWNTATEEVICNLIPCSRNSDGAAGFWDTAQERFFTSTYWTAHFDNE